jgi:hypothetical protein
MANSKSVEVKPFTSHGCDAFGANLVKAQCNKASFFERKDFS